METNQAIDIHRAKEASSAWPVYKKDQTEAESSLEQWCDIAWSTPVVPPGEARVELVLDFMREWYRNTDYDWRSFYAGVSTRSDLFPDEAGMEHFIALPALPPSFDIGAFFDLLDCWDDLRDAHAAIAQVAAQIISTGLEAKATGPAQLEVNGVTIESGSDTSLPSKLELVEIVCAMQSSCLRRDPEEADDGLRIRNLKSRLQRNLSLFKPSPDR